MTKSAYNRTDLYPVWCSRAFRLRTGRGAFSLFYTQRTRTGCIDRSDTIARASFLRVFFLPGNSPAVLETHFHSGQFWTAAFDVPLPRPTHVLFRMCARARILRAVSYAIHFLFYTSFFHLARTSRIMHRFIYMCVYVCVCVCVLTTAMSIIWIFQPQLPHCRARFSLMDRVSQLCR